MARVSNEQLLAVALESRDATRATQVSMQAQESLLRELVQGSRDLLQAIMSQKSPAPALAKAPAKTLAAPAKAETNVEAPKFPALGSNAKVRETTSDELVTGDLVVFFGDERVTANGLAMTWNGARYTSLKTQIPTSGAALKSAVGRVITPVAKKCATVAVPNGDGNVTYVYLYSGQKARVLI